MKTAMLTLFDRPCDPTHEFFYRKAFEELERGSPDDRAMVQNLAWDHRIGPLRAASFHAQVRHAEEMLRRNQPGLPDLEARALRRGLRNYFRSRIREQVVPDFAVPSLNPENVLNHDLTGSKLEKNLLLARLVNLNKLGDLFRRAKNDPGFSHLPIFRSRRGKVGPAQVDRWLNAALTKRPRVTEREYQQIKEDFVADVLKVLNKGLAERHDGNIEWEAFEPTWTTLWNELQPFLEDGPVRWSQVMGLSYADVPDQWVLLLVYPVEAVKIIARPSQLEADWYGRHYPSPKEADLRKGGHPVDLRYDPPARRLLSEYIHVQVTHEIQDFWRGGSRVELTSSVTPCDLDRARERHSELLRSEYHLP